MSIQSIIRRPLPPDPHEDDQKYSGILSDGGDEVLKAIQENPKQVCTTSICTTSSSKKCDGDNDLDLVPSAPGPDDIPPSPSLIPSLVTLPNDYSQDQDKVTQDKAQNVAQRIFKAIASGLLLVITSPYRAMCQLTAYMNTIYRQRNITSQIKKQKATTRNAEKLKLADIKHKRNNFYKACRKGFEKEIYQYNNEQPFQQKIYEEQVEASRNSYIQALINYYGGSTFKGKEEEAQLLLKNELEQVFLDKRFVPKHSSRILNGLLTKIAKFRPDLILYTREEDSSHGVRKNARPDYQLPSDLLKTLDIEKQRAEQEYKPPHIIIQQSEREVQQREREKDNQMLEEHIERAVAYHLFPDDLIIPALFMTEEDEDPVDEDPVESFPDEHRFLENVSESLSTLAKSMANQNDPHRLKKSRYLNNEDLARQDLQTNLRKHLESEKPTSFAQKILHKAGTLVVENDRLKQDNELFTKLDDKTDKIQLKLKHLGKRLTEKRQELSQKKQKYNAAQAEKIVIPANEINDEKLNQLKDKQINLGKLEFDVENLDEQIKNIEHIIDRLRTERQQQLQRFNKKQRQINNNDKQLSNIGEIFPEVVDPQWQQQQVQKAEEQRIAEEAQRIAAEEENQRIEAAALLSQPPVQPPKEEEDLRPSFLNQYSPLRLFGR